MVRLLHRLFLVASAAFFIASPAFAQSSGNVTAHAFALGKGAGSTSFTSLLCGSAQLAVGQSAADPICRTITGDVTITAAGVTAIGASKVTNSQLATMAANTTKCNATVGTANPTDCTASTMRTNMGVVIGTNVQAWDTDLDCLAALSSTGQIKRTGSGACSAGSVALSDLATGTQDTVIGYFGSTTATGAAVPNCTGALTYSTATHLFGCNAAAGTGTVTTITAGFGVSLSSGATCTTTCTVAVALTGTGANSLSADVLLNNTANYFDGPSVTLGAGRYLLTGTVTLTDTAGPASYYCKLWDGTTVIASAAVTTPTLNYLGSISIQGTAAPGGSTTYKISCRDTASASGKLLFNTTGNSKDSTLSYLQIQ